MPLSLFWPRLDNIKFKDFLPSQRRPAPHGQIFCSAWIAERLSRYACCGVVRNDCWDVSAPRPVVFKLSAALLPPPKPAIPCTSWASWDELPAPGRPELPPDVSSRKLSATRLEAETFSVRPQPHLTRGMLLRFIKA